MRLRLYFMPSQQRNRAVVYLQCEYCCVYVFGLLCLPTAGRVVRMCAVAQLLLCICFSLTHIQFEFGYPLNAAGSGVDGCCCCCWGALGLVHKHTGTSLVSCASDWSWAATTAATLTAIIFLLLNMCVRVSMRECICMQMFIQRHRASPFAGQLFRIKLKFLYLNALRSMVDA